MFNRKKSKYPPFRILQNFYRQDFYFLRNTEWSRLNQGNILVTDPRKLTVRELTDWSLAIFSMADGTRTVKEFIYLMADQYSEKIPETLDHLVIFKMLDLEKENLIVFTQQRLQLRKEYNLPGLRG